MEQSQENSTSAFQFHSKEMELTWQEDLDLLFFKPIGKHDEREARMFVDNYKKCCETLPLGKPVYILSDLSQSGGLGTKGRKVTIELFKHSQLAGMAIYNVNSFDRAVITFIMFAAGKRNVCSAFKTKEEAVAWVQSRRS